MSKHQGRCWQRVISFTGTGDGWDGRLDQVLFVLLLIIPPKLRRPLLAADKAKRRRMTRWTGKDDMTAFISHSFDNKPEFDNIVDALAQIGVPFGEPESQSLSTLLILL